VPASEDSPQQAAGDRVAARILRLTESALAHSDPMVWQAALRQVAALTVPPKAPAATACSETPPVLIITRGLPASGKTSKAITWVAERPQQRVRANRDSPRAMMHGGRLGTPEQEAMVTTAQHASIRSLLGDGIDVVADDTNLAEEAVNAFRQLAAEAGSALRGVGSHRHSARGMSAPRCGAHPTGPCRREGNPPALGAAPGNPGGLTGRPGSAPGRTAIVTVPSPTHATHRVTGSSSPGWSPACRTGRGWCTPSENFGRGP
jgi:hypothetical protein